MINILAHHLGSLPAPPGLTNIATFQQSISPSAVNSSVYTDNVTDSSSLDYRQIVAPPGILAPPQATESSMLLNQPPFLESPEPGFSSVPPFQVATPVSGHQRSKFMSPSDIRLIYLNFFHINRNYIRNFS